MPAAKRLDTVDKETRAEDIKQLVDRLLSMRDAKTAYLCLALLAPDFNESQVRSLVEVICSDQGPDSDETTFYTLHRIPNLPTESRDALLAHIVELGDPTTCNEVLLFVPNLGPWEEKLRAVLYD